VKGEWVRCNYNNYYNTETSVVVLQHQNTFSDCVIHSSEQPRWYCYTTFKAPTMGITCPLCSSRKNPYPPHGRSSEIPRGKGVLKAEILEANYEAKQV